MELNEAVALRIEELLKEKQITAYRLFILSGVPQATISGIQLKRSHSVRLDTIYALSQGFGISIAEFFDSPLFKGNSITD